MSCLKHKMPSSRKENKMDDPQMDALLDLMEQDKDIYSMFCDMAKEDKLNEETEVK